MLSYISESDRYGRSYSLPFNPQFQCFKLVLGHALQGHRRRQIQSGNVFHFAAPCYLATEFLYLLVSAHFQKYFIRSRDGHSLFNQAMLNQNAMIRRYCQRRWMGRWSALALLCMFHCTMLTRFRPACRKVINTSNGFCGSSGTTAEGVTLADQTTSSLWASSARELWASERNEFRFKRGFWAGYASVAVSKNLRAVAHKRAP